MIYFIRHTLLLVSLTFTLKIVGQNTILQNGLKVGSWSDTTEYDPKYRIAINSGRYDVVPLCKYKIIRKSQNFIEIIYKKSPTYIFFDKIINDSISIRVGIWKLYDSSGKMLRISEWQEGVTKWSKDYDSQRNLIECSVTDYESGYDTSLTFVNNRLFLKKISSLNIKSISKKIYYPDDNLIILNSEYSLSCDFTQNKTDTIKLILSSKNNTEIKKMIDTFNNFIFLDYKFHKVNYPLKILSKKKTIVYAIYKPSPESFREDDKFLITTSDSLNNIYSVYASSMCYHLNYKTIENFKKIILSKSKDKYLVIPGMGTVTDLKITNIEKNTYEYSINSIQKIDLSQFKTGTYSLSIQSCNAGGTGTLVIKE